MKKNIELDKDKIKKKGNKTWKEFKEFISKGNVMDLAIGVIIGTAFGKIVSSIVDDILMPIIGVIIGGIDFSNLSATIGEAKITYGNFLQNVIDFLIIAICVFLITKLLSRFSKKEEAEEKVEEVKREENTILLEEIRDLLKESKK